MIFPETLPMRFPLPGVRPVLLAALVLVLSSAAGCAGGLQPVQGKVTLEDGTPLTKGLVVVESAEGKPPITARGDIQADGSYRLSTYKPGDGVPLGKYRVLISAQDFGNIDGLEGPRRPPPFDKRYTDFGTSGLEFEVTAGSNDFPIHLTKAGKARR
jgi:hypothetical protein